MKDFSYNTPNTRERVAARRRKAQAPAGQGGTPGPRHVLRAWVTSGRIVSLALVIAALGGFGLIALSDRFTITDVQVTGAQILQPETVVELAGVTGQSVWFVDTTGITERLKVSPYVEQARVSVEIPDRIEITLVERRPEVRWQLGGTRYLVDATGLVLGVDSSLPLSNTLVIEDRSIDRLIKPSDRLDPDVLKLAQTLAVRLPQELQVQPHTIGWDNDKGLFVTMIDQKMIIFGRSERLDQKLAVLAMLLGDQTPFVMLDLRPANPYYRTDGGAAPPPQPEATPVQQP
jgi:cell division protein FtsQ